MRVMHDDCGSLPVKTGELAGILAMRNDEEFEQFFVLCNNRPGWQASLISFASIEERGNRSGSKNPATTKMELFLQYITSGSRQLLSQRAPSSMWQGSLICSEKEQKNLTDIIIAQKINCIYRDT